jgi:hypothetical protein
MDLAVQLMPPRISDDAGVPLSVHHLEFIGKSSPTGGQDARHWVCRQQSIAISARRCFKLHLNMGFFSSRPLSHPKYGFLNEQLVAMAAPTIALWANRWTATLKRTVAVKAFGSIGPKIRPQQSGNFLHISERKTGFSSHPNKELIDMWRLVLLVPFFATLSRQEILEMASNLRLTVNRTDDWDSQIAFSLCGETGSVRLFRKSDEEAVKMAYNYEFYGTASNEEDAELVKRFFGPC